MNEHYYDARRRTTQRLAAAALHYDPVGSEPPEVLAAGFGLIAEEILKIANDSGIPLREDAQLVEALARLEIGSFIPRELYAVVAEVIAYVYRVDAQAATR